MLNDLVLLLSEMAIMWLLFFAMVFIKPHGLINCFLLLSALFCTVLNIGVIFSKLLPCIPLVMFIITIALVLLVPVLLIINGIIMIKRERASFENMLSLLLGVVIATGEISGAMFFIFDGIYLDLGQIGKLNLLIFLSVVYFSTIILSFILYAIFINRLPHDKSYDYIVIHGCGLIDGRKMSKILTNRVDKAIKVYENCNRSPVIIASGGKGGDENLSEAEAMKDYLLKKGIPEGSVIMEDKSETTMENLIYSKKIIESRPGEHKTALVTSNYHVYRCIRYASKLGWKCTGIGAEVASYYWLSAVLREFAAVFTRRKPLIFILSAYILLVVLPVLIVLYW